MTLNTLQQRIAYTFKEPGLLVRALTHPSKGGEHYERLEFLGDGVLDLAVSDWLFERFPEAAEGELNRRYVALVKESALTVVAEKVGLGDFVVLGPGEVLRGSILADALEALVGALWLDGGWEAVKGFVRREWAQMVDMPDEKDAKTRLQEWLEGRKLGAPVYEVVEESGPAHEKIFRVVVKTTEGEAEGQGRSKQVAGMEAAINLLKKMGI